jgi:hypothetical protein
MKEPEKDVPENASKNETVDSIQDAGETADAGDARVDDLEDESLENVAGGMNKHLSRCTY